MLVKHWFLDEAASQTCTRSVHSSCHITISFCLPSLRAVFISFLIWALLLINNGSNLLENKNTKHTQHLMSTTKIKDKKNWLHHQLFSSVSCFSNVPAGVSGKLIYSEVTVRAAPWYSLSFSGAILEEVVRCCLSVFILVLHNIVLGVSKPLNSHEKVSDRIWLSSLLDKESAAINLCGTGEHGVQTSPSSDSPFWSIIDWNSQKSVEEREMNQVVSYMNRLVYPSLPVIIMWLSFQKSSSWIYFLEHQNINFTRSLNIYIFFVY